MPKNKKDKSVEELIRQIFDDTEHNHVNALTPGAPSNIFSVSSLPMTHPLQEKTGLGSEKIYIASHAGLETLDDKITVLREK